MARKILLADDSVTAQNMGRKILADAGYEVITVNNGSAALKRIAETKPDLIVLDVYMPGYSGLEVCQRLKDSNDTARIPILLTVGKLEPFKPEEARRVRAEAFIVKPFEASELLSALTKLEDKIVPRGDSSKPGRFARAIAAVEEGRYDKTVAIDEDSGWKSRISFPRKKKEKSAEPEDGDDPAIYNAVNRDLKTVVDPKPEHAPQPVPALVQTPVDSAAQPDVRVDLGALVAHGLPKDVTPEEIAALAAAAAQVQDITGSAGADAGNTVPASAAEFQQEESHAAEEPVRVQIETHAGGGEVKAGKIKSEPCSIQAATAPVAVSAEIPVKAPSESKAGADAKESAAEPIASLGKASIDAVATDSAEEQKNKDDAEPEAKTVEVAKESVGSSASETGPVVASFAGGNAGAPASSDSGIASANISPPEPVTMAAAAAQVPAVSRWNAVAVALTSEEMSILLEEEMRRAQAALASSPLPEGVPVPVGDRTVDEPTEVADTRSVAEFCPPKPEATCEVAPSMVTSVETTTPATAAETFREELQTQAASASPGVKEFETVALPDTNLSPADMESRIQLEPVSAPLSAETEETPGPVVAISESVPEDKPSESPSASPVEQVALEAISSSAISQAPDSDKEQAVQPDSKLETIEAGAECVAERQEPQPAEPAEISIIQAPENQLFQENMESDTLAAKEQISGGSSEMVKKESEIAASTAAAWASWRQIRETDGKSGENPADKDSDPASAREDAAMAVAAGAEKAPEERSDDAEVSPEIASIVDTVLADLRPKIVEEISRKLNKKK